MFWFFFSLFLFSLIPAVLSGHRYTPEELCRRQRLRKEANTGFAASVQPPLFLPHIYIFFLFYFTPKAFPALPLSLCQVRKVTPETDITKRAGKKKPCTQSAEVAIDERLNKNRRRKTQFLAGVGKQEWFICLKKKVKLHWLSFLVVSFYFVVIF